MDAIAAWCSRRRFAGGVGTIIGVVTVLIFTVINYGLTYIGVPYCNISLKVA